MKFPVTLKTFKTILLLELNMAEEGRATKQKVIIMLPQNLAKHFKDTLYAIIVNKINQSKTSVPFHPIPYKSNRWFA